MSTRGILGFFAGFEAEESQNALLGSVGRLVRVSQDDPESPTPKSAG